MWTHALPWRAAGEAAQAVPSAMDEEKGIEMTKVPSVNLGAEMSESSTQPSAAGKQRLFNRSLLPVTL
jgi:hypothetical protein